MKKLYTLALALATAAIMAVASPALPQKYAEHQSGTAMQQANPRSAADRVAKLSRDSYAPIYSPEGEKHVYLMRSLHFQLDFMGGLILLADETEAEIIWGNDGAVYLKDVMVGLPTTGVYIEGEYTEQPDGDLAGTIRVELPQVCVIEDDGEGEVYNDLASLMHLYIDDEGYVVAENVAADDNFVIYNVYTDGTIRLALNDGNPNDATTLPPYIVGLTDTVTEGEDTWWGYGYAYVEMTEFPYDLNVIPDGVELDTWAVISNTGNKIIDLGIADGTVYITNFSVLRPNAVICGTIDGDKVTFDCHQYLGSYDGMMLFFQAVEWESLNFMHATPLDKIVMNYDAEAKRISVDNPLVDIGVSIGEERDALWEYYEDAVITWLDQALVNANPMPPTVVYFDEFQYRDWYEAYEGYIEWEIPMVNVNEQPLDPARMYYNLYADGELMTLTVEDYPLFDEDLTDIPYDYTDGYDLQVIDESHYLTFKFDGADTFGCQSFFQGTDGKIYASGIVTYDVATGECGVQSVEGVAGEVRSIDYYNLQGQRVANPQGVTLVKVTYADGTTSTVKTLIKKK